MKNSFFEVSSWYVCHYQENNNIFAEKMALKKMRLGTILVYYWQWLQHDPCFELPVSIIGIGRFVVWD